MSIPYVLCIRNRCTEDRNVFNISSFDVTELNRQEQTDCNGLLLSVVALADCNCQQLYLQAATVCSYLDSLKLS